MLAAGQVLRRGGEYGIAKPSREVLFTVVDAETKYKAKNFIDTVLQRGSDLVGIGLVTLAHAAGFGLARLRVDRRRADAARDRGLAGPRPCLRTTRVRHFLSRAAVQARGNPMETRMIRCDNRLRG